jgi:hypothetical protein
MKKSVIGSVIILVYVNLVPYVSRIWRGVEWVAQYLPDEDHRLSGLLFFGGFASLPAIPLMVAFASQADPGHTFRIDYRRDSTACLLAL